MSGPLVIAHRGASGYRPEHTALAYRLGWRQGADSVETDVVATRDGVLLCRHDLELSRTTDVAERPEFAPRRRVTREHGQVRTGWYVHDFDLAELRTLRARERWPRRRPVSARYDDRLGLVTLDDLLDLREDESARSGRTLGVHVELKHAALLAGLGLPLDEPLVASLRARGLAGEASPVTVMSFEHKVLRRLRHQVDTPQVRLFDKRMPVRRRDLERTRDHAVGVGLHKDLVLRGPDPATAPVGKALTTSVAAGLDVLVWTLRSENRHLPAALRAEGGRRRHGDAAAEVRWFVEAGVDGVITDFPDVAARVRLEGAAPLAL